MADASPHLQKIEPWQQRLLDEAKELNNRLAAIANVLGGNTPIVLQPFDRDELVAQRAYMLGYETVLHRRIAKLVPPLLRGV